MSNFTIEQLQHLISVSKTVPAVNQIEMHPYLAQAALKQYCEVSEGENVVSPCFETDPTFDLSSYQDKLGTNNIRRERKALIKKEGNKRLFSYRAPEFA